MIIGIIGGGASGMAAALAAAQNPDVQVLLFERQARLGRKLQATGNGRCNLSNIHASERGYHGQSPDFIVPALSRFDPEETLRWFHELGLFTVCEPSGRVYPYSDQANSVLDVLRFALEKPNIRVLTGTEVSRLRREKGGFSVDGTYCDRVIVACGGLAGSKLGGTMSGSVAAERVRELTQLPKEPRNAQNIEPQGLCSVTMEDVRVAYTADRKVLTDVSITVPGGKIVALVGPSGEGKTTLLRLLLGLLRPEEGSLFLEDESGVRYPLGADTRHCFSYVPQGNTIIAGTVAENLRLGKEDASDEELRSALEAACAWEFVKELPQGMDTPIGEGGKGLSEGQAQRISIARALIRSAPVLLLDEVTSALDKDTEQRVLENLTNRGVTTLLTTHRLSVLDRCARVYRVEDGKVERQ